MSLTFEEKLQRYADVIVKIGVGLQPNQPFFIRAPLEAAPLVRLITTAAYKSGAKLVDVLWHDDALTLTRFKHAPRDSFEEYPTWRTQGLLSLVKNNGAYLVIKAEQPNLLENQDSKLVALAEKVHQTHMKPVLDLAMKNDFNWSIVSMPINSWATKLYPNISSAEKRLTKLWDLIFSVCRIDTDDPVKAWQHHQQILAQKKDYLNSKKYQALHYKSAQTDVTVGLPDNHVWHGVGAKTPSGINFIPNLPTEEIFTMNHKNRVDGVIHSTKPLSYSGVLIDDFRLIFKEGRVVDFSAKTGETALRHLIETDEGSHRLGEVALVPHSSPISQSGLLFYNTLFDENASSHFAIGKAYPYCMADGETMSTETFASAGGNQSLTHVDFMIGSADLNVNGITATGEVEPIMQAGEWAF